MKSVNPRPTLFDPGWPPAAPGTVPPTVASSAPPQASLRRARDSTLPVSSNVRSPLSSCLENTRLQLDGPEKVTDRSKMDGGPNSFPFQPDAASSTTLYDAPQLLHTCQPPLCHAERFCVCIKSGSGRGLKVVWSTPGRCPPAHPGPNGRAWRPPSKKFKSATAQLRRREQSVDKVQNPRKETLARVS